MVQVGGQVTPGRKASAALRPRLGGAEPAATMAGTGARAAVSYLWEGRVVRSPPCSSLGLVLMACQDGWPRPPAFGCAGPSVCGEIPSLVPQPPLPQTAGGESNNWRVSPDSRERASGERGGRGLLRGPKNGVPLRRFVQAPRRGLSGRIVLLEGGPHPGASPRRRLSEGQVPGTIGP